MKLKVKDYGLNLTGSGVSLSSSDGLFGVFLELFEVVLGGRDLVVVVVAVSESLHCSTSTSTSSSPSAKRSTDEGPHLKIKQFN